MSEAEFGGVLDLSDADGSGVTFEAIPTGKYQTHIHAAEWKQTDNPDGSKKLPDGTPYLNVQLRVDEDEPRDGMTVKNRTLFAKFFMPPADYEQDKAMRMKNSLVNFLVSSGYKLEDIQTKKFKIDIDDLVGRQQTTIVKKYKNDYINDWDNNVQGFKPEGDTASSDRPAGALV